jgi:hypothetical protein
MVYMTHIPTHDDVEKYQSDGGSSYWDGYYDQFVRGRAYLEGLKESLVARKQWLEQTASEKSGTP